jgi:hypothetical protein
MASQTSVYILQRKDIATKVMFSTQSEPWCYKRELAAASHAALPVVTLQISLYTNVILAFDFDFDFGLDHPVHGDKGEGALHRKERK